MTDLPEWMLVLLSVRKEASSIVVGDQTSFWTISSFSPLEAAPFALLAHIERHPNYKVAGTQDL